MNQVHDHWQDSQNVGILNESVQIFNFAFTATSTMLKLINTACTGGLSVRAAIIRKEIFLQYTCAIK